MTYYPKVAALWTHARRDAEKAARHYRARQATYDAIGDGRLVLDIEADLRTMARRTLAVLQQELLTIPAHCYEGQVCVDRHEMLHLVEGLVQEAEVKRPSAPLAQPKKARRKAAR